MDMNWHPGMSSKEEHEFFSDFTETLRNNYNYRHRPRLFEKWRKEPEPEPWLPVYDDMVLSYLTPKEIKKYEEAGETKKDMIARAKEMIFEAAWKARKPYEDVRDNAELAAKKEAFRNKFEKDPVYHTMSIVSHKTKLRPEYAGKPEAWEYPDVLAEIKEAKREEQLGPVRYMMKDCPVGRRSWELLRLNQYAIDFGAAENAVCDVDTEKKTITLNPAASKEACALSLVRSARLVQTDVYSAESSPEIAKIREADALSAQLVFAESMRRKNPKILATFKAGGNEDLCALFERTMNETNDESAARSACVDSCLNKTLKDPKPTQNVIAQLCRNEYGLSYYVPSEKNKSLAAAVTAKAKQAGR